MTRHSTIATSKKTSFLASPTKSKTYGKRNSYSISSRAAKTPVTSVRPHYQSQSRFGGATLNRSFSSSASVHRRSASSFWQQNFFWLLALGLFFLISFFLINHFFVVTKVYCTLNRDNTPCPLSLATQTQNLIGKPMLFSDISSMLTEFRTPVLNFTTATYKKVLPGTILVNFDFAPALYQLTLPTGQTFSFDRAGRYTLAPVATDNFAILIAHPATANSLVSSYTLDSVLAQKFAFLEYFSREKRHYWQKVIFYDLDKLAIVADDRTYMLDLFSLDENLQKFFYLQKNWTPADSDFSTSIIDLRFRLPVIRAATDSATSTSVLAP